ncbi:hypothetical protein BDN72DRAFT_843293 [Pluteus cervinus]|uniref:Uncharacterized protein n=1 Tax=Pluteus cervinus TaxID=181527 RepID=A0ACD3AMX0_9AGAR|nr:hypothetical protein BDN72DRAFT_843293 [Pluteus cervinus]
MSSTKFLDLLPQELILLIAETIPKRATILALWSTCRQLRELLAPQAFSHLILDFRGEPPRVRSSINHLNALADGTALACRYARTMEIWSLRNLEVNSEYTRCAEFVGDRDFGFVLEEAMNNLECLKSLSWFVGYGEVTDIEGGVLRAVRFIESSSQDFTVTVAATRAEAAVVQVLRDHDCSTSLLLVAESGIDAVYGGLKYYCRRDTAMLAFDIDLGNDAASKDTTYWLPAANFKSLQTLKISQIQVDVSQTIFCQSAFWMALRDAGCQPLELAVGFITDTMLDYLISFSNLRYLCIQDTREHKGVHDSEYLATKFYKQALRAHRETLQTLVVDVWPLPGPWFLQHSNMDNLLLCRNLKRLAISLPSPIDVTSQVLLHRALNLRKSLRYLYQFSILETPDAWLSLKVSRFHPFIEAFKGKGPPITALGLRQIRFKTRFEVDGDKKVVRYHTG